MTLKKFVAALAAVSLATAPTMAVAQPAEEESVEREGSGIGQILPVFVIIVIVLLIRELVKDDDSGDPPISP